MGPWRVALAVVELWLDVLIVRGGAIVAAEVSAGD